MLVAHFILDGHVKCTRHILWSSIWSKTISHRHTQGSLVGSDPCHYTQLHYLGILRAYSSCSSGQRNWYQAQQYTRLLIPSLSDNGLLRCIVKFLQTQSIVFPMVITTGLTNLLHTHSSLLAFCPQTWAWFKRICHCNLHFKLV